jgi:hypothetical protein
MQALLDHPLAWSTFAPPGGRFRRNLRLERLVLQSALDRTIEPSELAESVYERSGRGRDAVAAILEDEVDAAHVPVRQRRLASGVFGDLVRHGAAFQDNVPVDERPPRSRGRRFFGSKADVLTVETLQDEQDVPQEGGLVERRGKKFRTVGASRCRAVLYEELGHGQLRVFACCP